ncbi:alpha/beta family hydrolase [Marinobacter sp.]|uniref:alpha/beta family hydrolase n=1 Tax=Marinobacter sp. TaxID=50741 RepID=UPI0025C419C3|nr:alpha/beta family hydrolase [Marinobacter sp.]
MYTMVEQAAAGKATGDILVLAHGAGAPADAPFMNTLAGFIAAEGVTTVRFEFPYMQKRREDGKKRPPDRQAVLLDGFSEIIDHLVADAGENARLFIGGKSMGGRMATLLAASPDCSEAVRAVVCFGYPFHPPGKPEKVRTGHFDQLRCLLFIAQGSRDPFGRRDEFAGGLPGGDKVTIHWLEGGNHDLKPLAKQKLETDALIHQAAVEAVRFMAQVSADG